MLIDMRARSSPDRYAADVPFPSYSYVPGMWPHPVRDPRGHSFGLHEAQKPPIDPDHWDQSPSYLYGIDLFNHGFYWEAHEVWESLWHAAGRTGPTADFLKGLIKLAAAGVKVREARPNGVLRHARRAAELFAQARSALGVDRFLGLRFTDLEDLISEALCRSPSPADSHPSPVEVVLSGTLRLSFSL